MTDEVVARLHRCLVDALRKRGHPPDRPLKVSQIYQEVVPYRAVRSSLQVELNADYEHALLRLLAGERGLLRLEPEEARKELEREVAEPYPFVGLFRKFSASDVWVDPALDGAGDPTPVEADAPSLPAASDTAEARTGPVVRPAAAPAQRSDVPVAGAGPAAVRDPVQLHLPPPVPPPADELTHGLSSCVFCDGQLPSGRRVRFCPFCGADQRLRPCARCDAVLERDWHYCISCGHEQG